MFIPSSRAHRLHLKFSQEVRKSFCRSTKVAVLKMDVVKIVLVESYQSRDRTLAGSTSVQYMELKILTTKAQTARNIASQSQWNVFVLSKTISGELPFRDVRKSPDVRS